VTLALLVEGFVVGVGVVEEGDFCAQNSAFVVG